MTLHQTPDHNLSSLSWTDPPTSLPPPQAAANVTVEPDQSPKISCRVHVVNNTESDMTLKHSQSSLRVYQAADIMDVAVVVQLQHADVSALEVCHGAWETSWHSQQQRQQVLVAAYTPAPAADKQVTSQP